MTAYNIRGTEGVTATVAWEWLVDQGISLSDPTRWLTDRDLEFIVRATATRRTDHDRIRDIIRDKPDFLEVLLEDERLFARMVADDEILLKVSPQLLFTVLLRRVRKLLRDAAFTVERAPEGHLPVFDASRTVRLLERPGVLPYLAHMMASFVRTDSRAVLVRRGLAYQRRVFSDMDVDDLMEMAEMVEPERRFAVYKRLGDVSLFLVGLFPEHVSRPQGRPRGVTAAWGARQRRPREPEEYVRLGEASYRRAADEQPAQRMGLSEVLAVLGDHFVLASKPLNVLSRQIIPLQRFYWFVPLTRPTGPEPAG